jgi:hypothetical protein
MKKKEWIILCVIAAIAAAAILIMTVMKNTSSADSQNSASSVENSSSSGESSSKDSGDEPPSETPKGQWIAIVHGKHVAQWFDSGVDGEYTVKGDYGTMVVQCLNGKWHVESVDCPNHTCEKMGWDDGTNFMPITCIPNNIFIGTETWVKNYLSENE